MYSSIHSSPLDADVPDQAISLITTDRDGSAVRVAVGVDDGVGVLGSVVVGVAVNVGEFVEDGEGVAVGVAVGLATQSELAALGLPRIGSPLASWPLTVMPSFVPQAEGLSGTIPDLSIDAREPGSPSGQVPPERLAVSTLSPEGPKSDKVSPLFPRAPE